jgi:glucose dehydrogenase
MSPLAMPCIKPPYGRIALVDLTTRKVIWNRRLGTTNESGPLGTKLGLALPMGVPLAAGSIVTSGGVIFFGSGMDRYFRAFDVRTGDELWRERLPGPGQATPMSYVAPRSKRQIVVITVPAERGFGLSEGGDAGAVADPLGGHVIAYALPTA